MLQGAAATSLGVTKRWFRQVHLYLEQEQGLELIENQIAKQKEIINNRK
jgi:hypothetical protein